MAALPLGPQSAAGGVSLPDSFAGELQVKHVSLIHSWSTVYSRRDSLVASCSQPARHLHRVAEVPSLHVC